MLEKPVLFDVTEQQRGLVILQPLTLEKPVLFDVTELGQGDTTRRTVPSWKSRFYLMSRNTVHFSIATHEATVGKAGFI